MNKILISTGITFVFASALLVSVPQAKAAEYPNITVGSNLSVGSVGQGVVVLQGLMSELGYLNVPAGIPFGYYGSLTQSAVARYQASQNVTPAVGYFGPMTKNAMRSDFAPHGWLGLLGW
jgi:peptidoglycan hydrolase-like protein with peptidoglycan-binding domain